MRFERLVIDGGDDAFVLDLHPRLTVIAGVGQVERHALVAELLGALAAARPGVHVEVAEDSGRRLAVVRTRGGARVVDVDRTADVTSEYTDDVGRVDLLRRAGIDLVLARRNLRFGASDLHVAGHGAQLVRQLAEIDQPALWATAEALLAADAALQAEAEATGSSVEDAELFEQVEQRHVAFEAAQARFERIRRLTLAASATGTAGTLVALVLGLGPVAIGIVLAALLAMLASVVTRNRAERARAAEEAVLAAAGAQSYLGFHLQRVNGMLSSDASRKRLMTAAEEHRRAGEAWRALAGDIPVGWALEHHEEIAAAARVHVDIRTHAQMAAEPSAAGGDTTDLARVLVSRLAELRRLGAGGESLPLILDDPLADLDRSAKPALLELLSHTAGSPQLVYLTGDEDVASWARLEALTGALAIIEPTASPSGVDRSHRPRLIEI